MIDIPEHVQGFGNTLRWLRTEQRKTINQVAKALEMTASWWSDAEHDRVKFTPVFLDKVAKFFDVSSEQLQARVGTVAIEAATFWQHPRFAELRELLKDRRCTCPCCVRLR